MVTRRRASGAPLASGPEVEESSPPPTPPSGPEALCVELVDISTLVEDPQNARVHPERNLAAVAASLARFGQRKPIVVRRSDGVVLAGNGTLRAALSLGWREVSVAWTDLSGDAARAFAIADNRTSELSSWDTELAIDIYDSLSDVDKFATGFDSRIDSDLASIGGDWESGASDPAREFGLRSGRRGAVVSVLISVSDVALFERAMRATGNGSRSEALLAICRRSLGE